MSIPGMKLFTVSHGTSEKILTRVQSAWCIKHHHIFLFRLVSTTTFHTFIFCIRYSLRFITIKTHPSCVGFIVFSLLTSRYFASQFRLMWVANITEKEPQGVVNLKLLFLKHRLLTKRQANCMVSSNATPFEIIISRERLFHVLALRKDRRTW